MNLDSLRKAIDISIRDGGFAPNEELRKANLRRRPLVDMDESDLDCIAEASENAIFRPLDTR